MKTGSEISYSGNSTYLIEAADTNNGDLILLKYYRAHPELLYKVETDINGDGVIHNRDLIALKYLLSNAEHRLEAIYLQKISRECGLLYDGYTFVVVFACHCGVCAENEAKLVFGAKALSGKLPDTGKIYYKAFVTADK